MFGLGAAAFTASYTALQVPSNLVLQRVGAKAWLPAITAAWGAVSVASAAIRGPASFLALRALLGAAEAGCFPAMWAVCGEYYPPGFITFAYAAIEAAIALAQVLAAPLAAALLSTDGRLAPGLAGWQALFVFQGAATVVFAAVLRAMLPRDVDNAHWLTAADRAWIREARGHAAQQHAGALQGSSAGNGGGGEVQLGVLSPPRLGVGITEDVAAAAADVARLLPQGQAASSFEVAALAAPLAPAMTPWQQIVATARNRRVWLLVALKALKVRRGGGLKRAAKGRGGLSLPTQTTLSLTHPLTLALSLPSSPSLSPSVGRTSRSTRSSTGRRCSCTRCCRAAASRWASAAAASAAAASAAGEAAAAAAAGAPAKAQPGQQLAAAAARLASSLQPRPHSS